MAGFNIELPTEVLRGFNELYDNVEEMFQEMTKAGAEAVCGQIRANMKGSFKSTDKLEKGLKITRPYRTVSDGAVNTKVGFYGYTEDKVPIPLIALAREYGTSSGEKKKPFLRKAFNQKGMITEAMKKVQERYIKDEWL